MWYGAQVAETIHTYAKDYGFTVLEDRFDFKTLKAIVRPILIVFMPLMRRALSITGLIVFMIMHDLLISIRLTLQVRPIQPPIF